MSIQDKSATNENKFGPKAQHYVKLSEIISKCFFKWNGMDSKSPHFIFQECENAESTKNFKLNSPNAINPIFIWREPIVGKANLG